MGFRTDLALESTENLKDSDLSGINSSEYKDKNTKITKINITTEAAAQRSGKPMGDYVTVEVSSLITPTENVENETAAIATAISSLLPQGTVLVAGLGNPDITPDCIGPKTLSKIFATRHLSMNNIQIEGLEGIRDVTAISTGVLGQTGMESAEIVKSVCEKIKPAAVIAVDALACSDVKRLATTIQITNTGISPGSGVQNSRKELSTATLGIPVIAVGIPTVVDMSTIAENLSGQDIKASNMMVTPREIDTIVTRAAKMLSLSINKALLPTLSFEDIESLVS